MKRGQSRKRRKRTKAQNEWAHAKRRARERYGLELNRFDRKEIVGIIQVGMSELECRTSNAYKVHLVKYKDRLLRVVYDSRRKTICTFLPPKEGDASERDPTVPALRE